MPVSCEVYSSVELSAIRFSPLSPPPTQDFLILPKQKLCAQETVTPFFFLPSFWQPPLHCVTTLGTSCKWSLGLAYLMPHSVLKVYSCWITSQNFLLFKSWVIFHYMEKPHLLFISVECRHLSCFHFLPMVNSVANVNTGTHTSVQVHAFSSFWDIS
jgi:hypothetical protein